MTTLANLMVVLGLDPRPLVAGATTANASMMKLSTGAAKGLGAIPIGATAAGLAIGAFAAKSVAAAVSFDKAFTRIDAISNASAENIGLWKSQVMDLAGETARAPAELADALFFLSSAGLDTSQVMDTLEMSAKASAAGLGSTTDVAKITANALNAYAAAGLTATQVTDTLVAAVREGSAEPEEFAAALGRILPIASKAQVEFDEVTASLAALSNIGLDVNEGVTAMRGLMSALVAPTMKTQDALKKLGLSTDEVRSSLAEDGLIATLRMLEERTGGNIEQMSALVPNVRALTGVFGLTTQEAAKVDEIFNAVKNSTGSLAEAFRTTAESDSFKLTKALNDLQIAGQTLAMRALPLVAGSLQLVADHLQAVVEAAVAFKIARLMGAGIGPSLGLAAAVGLVAFGFETMARDAEQNRQVLEGWISALLDGTMTITSLLNEIESLKAETEGFGVAGEALRHELDAMGTTAVFLTTALGPLDGAFQAVGGALMSLEGPLEDIGLQMQEAAERVVTFGGLTKKEFEELANDLRSELPDIVGTVTTYKEAFSLSPNELKKITDTWARIGKTIAADLEAIVDSDLKPSMQAAIAALPPEMRHAWVEGNARQRSAIEASIRTTFNQSAAINRIINQMAGVAGSGGGRVGTALTAGMRAAIVAGMRGVAAAATAVANAAVEAAEEALQIDSPSKRMHEVGVNFMLGFTGGIRDQLGELISTIREVVGEGVSKARLLQAKELQAMADDVADRLENLRDKIQSFRSDIRSAFEIDLAGGLANLEELTAESAAEFLTAQVANAQTLAAMLQQLEAAGLGKGGLAAIAGQGVQGIPLAQLLLANPALLEQFGASQAAIAKAAGETTRTLVDGEFGEAIRKARENVYELRDAISAFVEDLRGDVRPKMKDLAKGLDQLLAVLDRLGDRPGGPAGGGGGGNGGPDWVGGSFGGGMNVTVNVYGDTTGEAVADHVEQALIRKLGRSGYLFNGAVKE